MFLAQPHVRPLNPHQRHWIPSVGAAPRSVLVADMRTVTDVGLRNLAASVEGLYNQGNSGKKIYLLWSDQDVMWLPWLKANHYISSYKTISGMKGLMKMAPTNEAVVCTDSPFHITDVAATLAGCKHELLVTDPNLVPQFHLKVGVNLVGKFQSNVQAYKWLFKNELRHLCRQSVAISAPYTPKIHSNLLDYLVANRIFTFWLSGSAEQNLPGANSTQERKVVGNALLKEFPANIPCFGYPWNGDGYGPGEGDGVTFLSHHAKWLVATDTFDNLSFWSTFAPSHRKLPKPQFAIIRGSTQHLASVVVSDGDNLCTFQGWFPTLWTGLRKSVTGNFPVAWTMGPTLRELAPPMFDYAIDHIPHGGSFGSGVSGIGYMSMQEWGKDYPHRSAVIHGFLQETQQACSLADEKWLWIMRYGKPGGWEIKDYAGIKGIRAILGGYGRSVDSPQQGYEREGRVSIFHDFFNASDVKGVESEITSLLASHTLPPRFQIFLMNWGTTAADLVNLSQFCRRGGIQLVSPEQLASQVLPSK